MEPDPINYQSLFLRVCQALRNGRLGLAVGRQRQLYLGLALDSFALGRSWGIWSETAFLAWLGKKWRYTNELKPLLDDWRRAGWLAVDVAEAKFRLAPDQLPGWADCFNHQPSTINQELPLTAGPHLASMTAEISQQLAEIPPQPAEIPSRRFPRGDISAAPSATPQTLDSRADPPCGDSSAADPNVTFRTFDRKTFKRSNVPERSERNVAPCGDISAARPSDLADQVRSFVGDRDWFHPNYWDAGRVQFHGAGIFTDHLPAVQRAFSYLSAGVTSGEIKIRTTPGRALWDQVKREIHRKLQAHTRP
jgi:hypothetical protein